MNLKLNKPLLLKVVLCLGALFYIMGAFAHFFCLTIFPFYDGGLCAPYQDSLLALACVAFTFILLFVAWNPAGNKETLRAIILSSALAVLYNFGVIQKIDFAALGGPGKKVQIICEGILGIVFVALLIWLYPRKNRR